MLSSLSVRTGLFGHRARYGHDSRTGLKATYFRLVVLSAPSALSNKIVKTKRKTIANVGSYIGHFPPVPGNLPEAGLGGSCTHPRGLTARRSSSLPALPARQPMVPSHPGLVPGGGSTHRRARITRRPCSRRTERTKVTHYHLWCSSTLLRMPDSRTGSLARAGSPHAPFQPFPFIRGSLPQKRLAGPR